MFVSAGEAKPGSRPDRALRIGPPALNGTSWSLIHSLSKATKSRSNSGMAKKLQSSPASGLRLGSPKKSLKDVHNLTIVACRFVERPQKIAHSGQQVPIANRFSIGGFPCFCDRLAVRQLCVAKVLTASYLLLKLTASFNRTHHFDT